MLQSELQRKGYSLNCREHVTEPSLNCRLPMRSGMDCKSCSGLPRYRLLIFHRLCHCIGTAQLCCNRDRCEEKRETK